MMTGSVGPRALRHRRYAHQTQHERRDGNGDPPNLHASSGEQ